MKKREIIVDPIIARARERIKYKLDHGNALMLSEKKYATADVIEFTVLDSCIGVVGRKGTELTGVHLVMDPDNLEPQIKAHEREESEEKQEAEEQRGSKEARGIVQQIIGLLKESEEVIIVGNFDMWKNSLVPNHQMLVLMLEDELRATCCEPPKKGRWVVGPWQEGTLMDCAKIKTALPKPLRDTQEVVER